MAAPTNMECEDFMEFQDTLKKMRVLDDKIIYSLNTSIPTDSFKGQVDATNMCKELHQHLQENFNQREAAIKKCINVVSSTVQQIKNENVASSEHAKNLKKERTKLRLLGSELNVEEIIRERTNKVFYERCRPFYKPSDIYV